MKNQNLRTFSIIFITIATICIVFININKITSIEQLDNDQPDFKTINNLHISSDHATHILEWKVDMGLYGGGVASDSQGYVYLTRSISSHILIKVNKDGSINWSRSRDQYDLDRSEGVTVDSEDNIYMTGWSGDYSTSEGGRIYTYKYNTSGHLQWEKGFGSNCRAYGITTDDENNVYVIGCIWDSGALGQDALIIKYNSSGYREWYIHTYLSGDDLGKEICYNPSSNLIYATGGRSGNMILYKVTKEGVLDWSEWNNGGNECGEAIIVDLSNGNMFVAGTLGCAFTVFSNTGAYLYNASGGESDAIAMDQSGNIFTTINGKDNINSYFYIIMYSYDGNYMWQIYLDHNDRDAVGIIVDLDNNIYLKTYANINSESLYKLKYDTMNPIITFLSPYDNESFGSVRPDVSVEIEDPNLEDTWYCLSNDSVSTDNYSWNGYIDQQVWDLIGDGNVTINLYANDTNSNLGYGNLTILKDTSLLFYWNLTNNPIYIDDSDPNYCWDKTMKETLWCYGSGTRDDPYVIYNVFIDGRNSGSCITISSSNIYFQVKNCTLINSGGGDEDAGIKLINVIRGELKNNTCINNGRNGIYLFESNNNQFLENNISTNGRDGFYIRDSDDNYIIENKISSNVNGLTLTGWTNNNKIISNQFQSNGRAVYMRFNTQYNEVIQNTIYKNDYGIFIEDGQYNVIYKNFIMNSSDRGIRLTSSYHTNISNNIINNSDIGIFLGNSDFNNISHNQVTINNEGIKIGSSETNTFQENNVSSNIVTGFTIINSESNRIQNNHITRNFGDGIFIEDDSYDNILKHNNLNNNLGNGIYFEYYSHDNILEYNDVYNNNRNGIFLDGYSNEIASNNIYYNNEHGILLDYGDFNNLFFNNISLNQKDGIRFEGINCNGNNISLNKIDWNEKNGIYINDQNNYNVIFGNSLCGYDNNWIVEGNNCIDNQIYNNLLDDKKENNDILSNAYIIIEGVYSNLTCSDDDWYKIYLNASMTITINLNILNDPDYLDIAIYNSEGNIFIQSVVSSSISMNTITSNDYYICINNGVNISYEMSISIEPTEFSPENETIPGYDLIILLSFFMLFSYALYSGRDIKKSKSITIN